MPYEKRPTSFWEFIVEVFGKAKATAGRLQSGAAIFITCLVAYLTWIGFDVNDSMLKLIPIAIFSTGIVICLFFYAWQIWKKEVEAINELRQERIELVDGGIRREACCCVKVLNKSETKTLKKPSVRIIACDPLVPGMYFPIHLHQDGDYYSEKKKQPEIPPLQDAAFEIVNFSKFNSEWRFPDSDGGFRIAEKKDYLLTLVVTAEDYSSPQIKATIKEINGVPCLKFNP